MKKFSLLISAIPEIHRFLKNSPPNGREPYGFMASPEKIYHPDSLTY